MGTIQMKRGTSAALTTKNILLLAGQPCMELDTGQMKIGNGTDKWNDLPYVGNAEDITQTNTTTNAAYRVLLSASANDNNEEGILRKSTNFRANPSTGSFYAKGYDRQDITGLTVNLNNYNLSSGSPDIMRFIERTQGGASNITNLPFSASPFILDVESIRWASTTDYVTVQTIRSLDVRTKSYVRTCNSGTWSAWQTQTFTGGTDTKVTNTLNTTTKAYITGTTSATTNTGTQIFDTGVYLDTVAGRLRVTTLAVDKALLSYDTTKDALKISFL